MSITDVRVVNPATGAVDGDLYDIAPLRDAFERFASGVVLKFLDPDGTKVQDYPYGRRVEVQYNTDSSEQAIESTFTAGFGSDTAGFGAEQDGAGLVADAGWQPRGGYVTLEPSRTTNAGIPIVEVQAVGYTHFLTRENPVKDYSDTAKSTILEDLVTTFSPVGWNPAKVDVQDDSPVDLSLRGSTPAEAVQKIASQSADENWVVDREFEFKFQPQDIDTAPSVDSSDVIDYDLPEKGARAINKFTVYWGPNEDNAWVEEDREAQQALADELGVDEPVVVAGSDSFPEITTESEAKATAQKRLGEQAVIQTGTVTTPLGYWQTEAGDVFSLSISDAGLDGVDFRVAQIDYNFLKGQATRTIAENSGGNVDELLVSLSESLTNERLQNVDPAATTTNALRIRGGVEVGVDARIVEKTTAEESFVLGQSELGLGTDDELGGGVAQQDTVDVADDAATRSVLNLLRDLWLDGAAAWTDLTHLSVGRGVSDPVRADGSLDSEAARLPVGTFDADATSTGAKLTATLPAGGELADGDPLRELGVQNSASGGDLFARLTTDAIDTDAATRANLRVTLAVGNDPETQGVVTATGQERFRDLLIGESGHEPMQFAYGDGDADPATSDTALDNQVYADAIDSENIGDTGTAVLVDRIDNTDTTTANVSEVGQVNSAGELLTRAVFASYGEPVTIETTYSVAARND